MLWDWFTFLIISVTLEDYIVARLFLKAVFSPCFFSPFSPCFGRSHILSMTDLMWAKDFDCKFCNFLMMMMFFSQNIADIMSIKMLCQAHIILLLAWLSKSITFLCLKVDMLVNAHYKSLLKISPKNTQNVHIIHF